MILKYKRYVYEVVNVGHRYKKAAYIYMSIISITTFLNILLLFDSSNTGIEKIFSLYGIITLVSLVVFTLDYCLRLFSIGTVPKFSGWRGLLKYSIRPMPVIDLALVIILFVILFNPAGGLYTASFFKILRLLRLLSIFKIFRYNKALKTIVDVLKASSPPLILLVLMIGILIIFLGGFMYTLEKDAQPEVFSSIWIGIYWAIVSFTTVGYGDVIPITHLGRVVASSVIIIGVVLIAVFTSIISGYLVEYLSQKRASSLNARQGKGGDKNPTEYKLFKCPYCDVEHTLSHEDIEKLDTVIKKR